MNGLGMKLFVWTLIQKLFEHFYNSRIILLVLNNIKDEIVNFLKKEKRVGAPYNMRQRCKKISSRMVHNLSNPTLAPFMHNLKWALKSNSKFGHEMLHFKRVQFAQAMFGL